MRQGEINYRGFFNLAAIILVLSNLRIVVDSHMKYGFLPAWTSILSASHGKTSPLDWIVSAPGISLLSWFFQIFLHFTLENFFVSKYSSFLGEKGILALNWAVGSGMCINDVIVVFEGTDVR